MLKKTLFLLLLLSSSLIPFAQDPWKLSAYNVNPQGYYGITVANGMIGIVSSPEPFKVKDVVLAGAYDLYGRGRVSNFLRSFNLLNMYLEIDGRRIDASNQQQYAAGARYAAAPVSPLHSIMQIKQPSPTLIIHCGICLIPC